MSYPCHITSDFFSELGEGVASFDSHTDTQGEHERGRVGHKDGAAKVDAVASIKERGNGQETLLGEEGPSDSPRIDTQDHTAV